MLSGHKQFQLEQAGDGNWITLGLNEFQVIINDLGGLGFQWWLR